MPKWLVRLWGWISSIQTVQWLWSLAGSALATFMASFFAELAPWQIVALALGVFFAILAAFGTWMDGRSSLVALPVKSDVATPPPQSVKGSPIATKEELTAPTVTGLRVRIHDLIGEDGVPVITNKTFRECRIEGPAVLSPVAPPGPHLIGRQTTNADFASFVYAMDAKPTAGVIGMMAVTFRQCDFYRVGFAVPADAFDHWQRVWAVALGIVLPPAGPTKQATPDSPAPQAGTDR